MPMESDFEILEFAIRREQESYNFYMALASKVEAEQIRQVLEELAQEELDHKAKLEMEFMKNGIVIDTQTKKMFMDSSRYVVSDEISIDLDLRDALEMCIQKEAASFRLYAEPLIYARDRAAKETLMGLMEQEIKHKVRFETEYEKLTKEK
jgi:rubrerythrin